MGKPRPFDFSDLTKELARGRQAGLCAHCGHSLRDLFENAHHVIPNQSGDPHNPRHAWLRTVDNCVVLCYMCHDRVHADAHFRTGAVAPPDYYPFSHGHDAGAHLLWVRRLDALARTVWS